MRSKCAIAACFGLILAGIAYPYLPILVSSHSHQSIRIDPILLELRIRLQSDFIEAKRNGTVEDYCNRTKTTVSRLPAFGANETTDRILMFIAMRCDSSPSALMSSAIMYDQTSTRNDAIFAWTSQAETKDAKFTSLLPKVALIYNDAQLYLDEVKYPHTHSALIHALRSSNAIGDFHAMLTVSGAERFSRAEIAAAQYVATSPVQ